MDLLLKSKRAWLLSFLIFCGLDFVIYIFWLDRDWLRTICFMVGAMLAEMTVFFILIVLFKWTKWTRRIMAALYLGAVIYAWVNGYIGRWYVIIPTLLLMWFFMLWNIGGVKNCVVASPYKRTLSLLEAVVNSQYEDYSSGIDRYNWRNGLGFFTKVRKKWKPFMWLYRFDSSGLDMFVIEDALFGVDTSGWESSVRSLSRKSGRLSDKISAIHSDEAISEERSIFSRIRQKNRELGINDPNYDSIAAQLDAKKKTGMKKQRKIFKRWI